MQKLIITYKENNRFNNHRYFVTVENIETDKIVEMELKIPKIYFLEKRKIRKLILKEIQQNKEVYNDLFNMRKDKNNDVHLNNLLQKTFLIAQRHYEGK